MGHAPGKTARPTTQKILPRSPIRDSGIREFLNVYVETFGNPQALNLEMAIRRLFSRSETPHLAGTFYSKKDFL